MTTHTSSENVFLSLGAALSATASELDRARRQEQRPKHLWLCARRASIAAMKVLSRAMEAGEFEGRGNLQSLFAIIHCGGTPNYEPFARRLSDDQLAWAWMMFVQPWIRSYRPDCFKADAGHYDFPAVRADKEGRLLDQKGRQIPRIVKKDRNGQIISVSLKGEPVRSIDNYNEVDWMAYLRLRYQDWGDAILALADILKQAGGNSGLNSPPLTHLERLVMQEILAAPKAGGILGKQIVEVLVKRGHKISQSTLTRHIIPVLKKHHGVDNRPGVGYYVRRARIGAVSALQT